MHLNIPYTTACSPLPRVWYPDGDENVAPISNKVSKKKGDHVGDSIVVITHSTKYWPHSKLTVSIFIKLLPVTPVIGVILSE